MSSSEDEDALENFMSTLKNDKKVRTNFVRNEAMVSKPKQLEYRMPKYSSGSESDTFEDAVENQPPPIDPSAYRDKKKDQSFDSSGDEKAKNRRFSESSDDDDRAFEVFVSSLKNNRVGVQPKTGSALKKSKSAAAMDSFIVDDDEIDDEFEETYTSGSEQSEKSESADENSEEEEGSSRSSSPDEATNARRLLVQLQLEEDRRLERKIICGKSPKVVPPQAPFSERKKKLLTDASSKVSKVKEEPVEPEMVAVKEEPVEVPEIQPKKPIKPKSIVKEEPIQPPTISAKRPVEKREKPAQPVEKRFEPTPKPAKPVDYDAEFLFSLSTNEQAFVGTGDEAKRLKRAFKKKRLEIAGQVSEIVNRRCFDSKMPMQSLTIEFTNRLLRTAGDATTKGALGARTCRIRLADKVCDTPGRLRDTLIHELCHAAVSMIDEVLHHKHGPLWKRWTKVIEKCFPSLPPVTVLHHYSIQTKYVYICQGCGHKFGRHSKSIDVNMKRCGHCHGILKLSDNNGPEIFEAAGTSEEGKRAAFATPRTEKPKNAWTSFVSENFASVKRQLPPKSAHKEVMSRLKDMYQSARAGRVTEKGDDFERVPPPMTPLIGMQRRPQKDEIDAQIDLILATSLNSNLNIF